MTSGYPYIRGVYASCYYFADDTLSEMVFEGEWQDADTLERSVLYDHFAPFLHVVHQGMSLTACRRTWEACEAAYRAGGGEVTLDWQDVEDAIRDQRERADGSSHAHASSEVEERLFDLMNERDYGGYSALAGDWPTECCEAIYGQFGRDFSWYEVAPYLAEVLDQHNLEEHLRAQKGHQRHLWLGISIPAEKTLIVLWSTYCLEMPLASDGDVDIEIAGRAHNYTGLDSGTVGLCYALPPTVHGDLATKDMERVELEEEEMRRSALRAQSENFFQEDDLWEGAAP